MVRAQSGYSKFAKRFPTIAKGMSLWRTSKIAQGAYRMAAKVASIINSEKKFNDVSLSPAPDTTANITCLTNMAQGDTELLRHGLTIKADSLQLKGVIYMDATNSTTAGEVLRIMIIQDKDNNNGTAPTITNILEASGVTQMRNRDNYKRFNVLFDKLYVCDTAKKAIPFRFFKKFYNWKDKQGNPTKGYHCTFTGANAADTAQNHIYFVVLGNVATASTASVLTIESRFRFYDN